MRDGGRAEEKCTRSGETVCRRVQARVERAVTAALLVPGKELRLDETSIKHRLSCCSAIQVVKQLFSKTLLLTDAFNADAHPRQGA